MQTTEQSGQHSLSRFSKYFVYVLSWAWHLLGGAGCTNLLGECKFLPARPGLKSCHVESPRKVVLDCVGHNGATCVCWCLQLIMLFFTWVGPLSDFSDVS